MTSPHSFWDANKCWNIFRSTEVGEEGSQWWCHQEVQSDPVSQTDDIIMFHGQICLVCLFQLNFHLMKVLKSLVWTLWAQSGGGNWRICWWFPSWLIDRLLGVFNVINCWSVFCPQRSSVYCQRHQNIRWWHHNNVNLIHTWHHRVILQLAPGQAPIRSRAAVLRSVTEADPLTSHSDHSHAPSGMILRPPHPPHCQHRHGSMETNEISVASLLCDYRL